MKLKMILTSTLILPAVAGLIALGAGCQKTDQADAGNSHSHAEQSSTPRSTQEQVAIQGHADRLYAAVKQSRSDLREMRIKVGLHAHASGPHIDPEGHHANDSPAQRERERNESESHEDGGGEGGHEAGGDRGHREGGHEAEGDRGHREGAERGHREGGERGHGEGRGRDVHESGNNRIAKMEKHVKTYKNGARLKLQYNPATQAFVGNVVNTTGSELSDVRVEIHLSNGVELGPTKRLNLKAGQSTPVELGAFEQKFTHWITHPEAGVEDAHGPGEEENEGHAGEGRGEHGGERGGHEGRERGEHSGRRGGHESQQRREHSHGSGSGEGHGPGDASLRPVYNQILLLRGEMQAFENDLKATNNR